MVFEYYGPPICQANRTRFVPCARKRVPEPVSGETVRVAVRPGVGGVVLSLSGNAAGISNNTCGPKEAHLPARPPDHYRYVYTCASVACPPACLWAATWPLPKRIILFTFWLRQTLPSKHLPFVHLPPASTARKCFPLSTERIIIYIYLVAPNLYPTTILILETAYRIITLNIIV